MIPTAIQVLPSPGLRVIADGLRFPEGPVALSDGTVLVVEIAGQALTRIQPDGRKEVVAELEGGPNGAALGPDDWAYVCNSGGWRYCCEANGWQRPTAQATRAGWIERVNLRTGKVERLYERCGRQALRAPNDLAFDHCGGFYFTDHGKRRPRSHVLGSLYYARADGSDVVEVVAGMLTPNGVGLSANGRTVYVAETLPRRLWAFELNGPGEIRREPWPSPNGGRLVAGLPGAHYPDSLAIDAAGHICVASFNQCGIWEIAPEGSVCIFRPLKDFYATNIAFGGPDLCTAFVTLSSTGRLVSFTWPRPGQALPYVNSPVTERANA
jgi:gluconolactonase